MLTWSELTEVRPELASVATGMFYEFGLGLGFLATVRPDGGPRVHPICPVLATDLYGFILEGPKLTDLRRDPRFALHSETFPPPRQDDGAYLTGEIRELDDATLRQNLTEQFLRERGLDAPWDGFETQALVEFRVDRVMVTLTEARDGFPQGHSLWRG